MKNYIIQSRLESSLSWYEMHHIQISKSEAIQEAKLLGKGNKQATETKCFFRVIERTEKVIWKSK